MSKSYRCTKNIWCTYNIPLRDQMVRKGQLKIGQYIIYSSGIEEGHCFGCGFTVHEIFKPYIKYFNPVSERIAIQRIDKKFLNIV